MSSTAFIDYCSLTDFMFNPDVPRYPERGLPNKWEKVKGGRLGYDSRYVHLWGIERMYNTLRRDMGLRYAFDGKALAEISNAFSMSRLKALLFIGMGDLRCSRIDLTCDVLMPLKTLGIMAKEAGKMNTGKTRNLYTVIGVAGRSSGLTIYKGKRTSEKFIRFYDSALMHGLPQGTIRMELELKGKSARYAWRTLQSVSSPTNWIRGILASLNEFESLKSPLGDAIEMEVETDESDTTDTKKWLLKQVIPTLVRDLTSPKSERLIQYIMEMVFKAYGEYPDGIVSALDAIASGFISELD